LHECDGDWFWYGKGTSAQFCRLWRTMFDYFTKERKLDNLIWVLCHTGDPSASFDPGEEYYDIAGADSYNTERVRKAMYDKTCLIHGSERPIAYHECGTIPDPDLCRKANVNWSWWMLWSREYAYNHDKDELKRIYNHDKVLTLDELPPIMDYLPDFPNVSVTATKGAFPLSKARICTDPEDFKVVSICAGMLADDIGLVCGRKAATAAISDLSAAKGSAPTVIAGTIGHSRLIDGLIAKGLLDVNDIKGKWESFVVTTVENPADKSPMLVIAGSDRRGTAFGLTSMSRAIGVSPWYWWADVTTAAKSALYVEPGRFRQGEPSVQYRGIFINDERFGGWAKWVENTFDKESGQVGPKVYRKVFELLLRLKGNYLWPAMHNGSKAFNANPENARLADDYAIVMGSSHCE
ncbi:MAG: glycosyl hydrolase 115 family protein, partial [Duncaniella sp.]|nr:glycosyl hydrolase 115 family protein [Duncaniella sp.]